MNYSNFEYFYELSKCGSIRDAAQTLNISQQALSAQVRRLEKELGVTLLADTRPATLTPCGKRFAEFSGELLYLRQQLYKDLADLSGQRQEILISIPKGNCPPILNDALAAFSEQEPGCIIKLEERPDNFTTNDYKKYDFNISMEKAAGDMEYIQLQAQNTNLIPSMQDPTKSNVMSLVAHRNLLRRKWGAAYEERLQRLKETKDLRLVQDIPFIREESFWEITRSYFRKKNFEPQIAASVSSPDASLALCQTGIGIQLAPDGWVLKKQGGENPDILTIPLDGVFPGIDFYISYQKGKEFTPQEKTFLSCICSVSQKNP